MTEIAANVNVMSVQIRLDSFLAMLVWFVSWDVLGTIVVKYEEVERGGVLTGATSLNFTLFLFLTGLT